MTAPHVPLAQVVAAAAEDQEPVPGFAAQLDGTEYVVTAVLQRTAVLEVAADRWADRRTAPLDDMLVDPATIAWRPKPLPAGYRAWRGRPRAAVPAAAQRAASDERARADQERKRAVEAAVVRAPARPVAVVARLGAEDGSPTRRPVSEEPHAAPVAPAQPPDPVRLLVDQLEQARARIAELEAEREHVRGAQRRLIRRARAAMRETVAS